MRALFITYNGLTEPLGRRQVLPYVVGLAARGWRHTILSFEKRDTASAEAIARVREIVSSAGIEWIPLRYHSRPTLPATSYDVLMGILRGARLANSVDIVHARSTVSAAMARAIARRAGRPWIFDVRGLVAEEYADAGHWRRGGAIFLLTHGTERRLVRAADGLVFLTERIRDRLLGEAAFDASRPATVIPCCVDLEEFRPSAADRSRIRSELGLGDRPVLAYVGSLSWYRLDEMMAFFASARRILDGLRFLILTPHREAAEAAARRRGIDGDVVARSLAPDDVPSFLAAADAGICFPGRRSSKEASFPTKYGEYLASGLPVVTNSFTGDAAALQHEPAWILVDSFDEAAYHAAARRLAALLDDRAEAVAAARAIAVRCFSLEMAVERYDALYQKVLDHR